MALAGRRLQAPSGYWSDSRALAFLAGIYGPHIFSILGIEGQRITYLSGDDLMSWGNWEKREGWYASNPSFSTSHACPINIQSDKDWRKDPSAWDNSTKTLVPIARRPEPEEPEMGKVTLISDGRIGPGLGDGEDLVLTKQSLSHLIFRLRTYCRREGYLSGMES